MKIKPTQAPAFESQSAAIGRARWNVARLAKLAEELPVFKLPVAHINLSDVMGGYTLREMAGHVQAVKDADMSKAIILSEDGEIMDGRHRVVRAIVDGLKSVKAVRFLENPDPCEWVDE